MDYFLSLSSNTDTYLTTSMIKYTQGENYNVINKTILNLKIF